jgi:hypothetical protein
MERKPDMKGAFDALQQRVKESNDTLPWNDALQNANDALQQWLTELREEVRDILNPFDHTHPDERTALLKAAKARMCARLKRRKITTREIAKAIGYRSTSEVYGWLRNDPSHATPAQIRYIEGFLLRTLRSDGL